MPLDTKEEVIKPVAKKTRIVDEAFLGPEDYTFSKNKERGDVHDYLMSIWDEEGQTPAALLELGHRISSRSDCKYSMLEICNALPDLAQDGRIRVKRMTMTNDRFNLYGIWEEQEI